MNIMNISTRRLSATALLSAFLLSGAALAQEDDLATRIAADRKKAEQKAKEFQRGFDASIQSGDLDAARTFELKKKAADNVVRMLSVDTDFEGQLVQVELYDLYTGIFAVPDFSKLSSRVIRNRTPSAGQRIHAPEVTAPRLVTNGVRSDIQALEALEDNALVLAQRNAHSRKEEVVERSMKRLPIQVNNAFAAVNPATGLIEAATGVRARGEDVGRELSAGERASSAVEGAIVAGAVAVVPSVARDAKTRAGSGASGDPKGSLGSSGAGGPRGSGGTSGSKGAGGAGRAKGPGGSRGSSGSSGSRGSGGGNRAGGAGGADGPDGAFGPNGEKPSNRVFDPTRTPRSSVGAGEEVVRQVNPKNVEPDDLIDLTPLDNFNLNLETGLVTTQPRGSGRIAPADRARIERDLRVPTDTDGIGTVVMKPPAGAGRGAGGTANPPGATPPSGSKGAAPAGNRVFDPTRGLSGGSPKGRGATRPRPSAPKRGGDGKRVGEIDLNDPDPLDIEIKTEGLDNFHIDLKTGIIKSRPGRPGRVSPRERPRTGDKLRLGGKAGAEARAQKQARKQAEKAEKRGDARKQRGKGGKVSGGSKGQQGKKRGDARKQRGKGKGSGGAKGR